MRTVPSPRNSCTPISPSDSTRSGRFGRYGAGFALVLTAALRREELQMEARLRLFSELGEYLEDALAHARPAHLSPEKWSLLVAAALLPKEGAGRKRVPAALGAA